MSKYFITGIGGFIGSHLADYLIGLGHDVCGIDNWLTGKKDNVNKLAKYFTADVRYINELKLLIKTEQPDYVYHLAAIARTPWTIDDPILANETNIAGTLNVLEACRQTKSIKKVVFASSNIVYAEETPYKVTKLAGEGYMRAYNKLFDLPTVSLRFSNIYGSTRQSMEGPSPNVLASLRKTMLETGGIEITGDGKQSRDFTHVLDLVKALYLAGIKNVRGIEIDICTGKNITMNQIAKWFNCPVKYVPERQGDIKHIYQDAGRAEAYLGFKTERKLKDYINIYTNKDGDHK